MAVSKLTIYNKALAMLGARRLATVSDDTEEQRLITDVYEEVRDEVLEEHPWSFAQKRAELINMTAEEVDDWEQSEDYAVGDEVKYNSTIYICLVAHTSGVFTDDLASLYWETETTWTTAVSYIKGDQVYNTGIHYTCLVEHTAGTFATDLASGYWIASEIPDMDEDGLDNVFYRPSDYVRVTLLSDTNAIVKFEGQRILSNVSSLKMAYTYQNDTPSEYSAQFRNALATRLASELCYAITNSASKAQALLEAYTKIALPKALSIDSQQGTAMSIRQDEWENARISGVGTGIAGNAGDQTWHPVG